MECQIFKLGGGIDSGKLNRTGVLQAETIRQVLEALVPAFESAVVKAIAGFLNVVPATSGKFEVAPGIPMGSSLFCILPSSNRNVFAIVTLGVNQEDLPAIFPMESEPKMRLDALGELSNVISGDIISNINVLKEFGTLQPSTPLFSEGPYTGEQHWSVQGKIELNFSEISASFAIRPVP